MPYYVYALKGFGRLEQLAVHERFAPASAQAKVLRQQPDLALGMSIKVIFAPDPITAEDLLLLPREAQATGGDD